MSAEAIDQQAITAFVVHELGKGRDRRDVIFTLCQQLNWAWPQAENFVVTIEHTKSQKIAMGQLPILLILGIGILIGGIGLLGFGVYRLTYGAWLSERTYIMIVTGLGMVCGGGWGTWKAVAKSIGKG